MRLVPAQTTNAAEPNEDHPEVNVTKFVEKVRKLQWSNTYTLARPIQHIQKNFMWVPFLRRSGCSSCTAYGNGRSHEAIEEGFTREDFTFYKQFFIWHIRLQSLSLWSCNRFSKPIHSNLINLNSYEQKSLWSSQWLLVPVYEIWHHHLYYRNISCVERICLLVLHK